MGLSKLWGKDSSGDRGFVFSHVKSIYYNWSQKKLLSTKLDEIDESISSLNSRIGSWSNNISMYVGANQSYEVDLPDNKELLLAVENSYGVGCLYFIQTPASSEGRDASVYQLARYSDYFIVESIAGQAAKVKVTPGEASGTLQVYAF